MTLKFFIAGEPVPTQRHERQEFDFKELGGLTRFNGTPDPQTGRSRVYGGDANLVHIKDGTRTQFGQRLGLAIAQAIREQAVIDGLKEQARVEAERLCPGCYMIALFNAAVTLAVENGQPLRGLGKTLAHAFAELEHREQFGIDNCREEIHVVIG